MTITATRRAELRLLVERSRHATDVYQQALHEVRNAVPDLLDEIERLEILAAERYEEAEELHAAAGEPTQSARPTIAGLRLQLSIATELNVNDRKQIEKLEARQQETLATVIALQTRQQELLATIVRLTNETPFPDELKGWEFQRAKMLTEIGTLRSRVAELDTALALANVVAGEAALVLEQQDRDLEKLRSALQEAINWVANRSSPESMLVERLRHVLG